ncbi:PhzF family phenazine biosynthesis protein [Fusobacterium nucleatum subsp. nucleatum ATCC 25586]|uniref:Phenazine biosynthesis protein phzF n=2 Tax=Fusobacterium nucleatum TaxID=851 RepID=Q8RDS9_FUSNN|nr:Phenazine biosynthesis protein phzF [Fusobacterium nucleatum subsp. nucleatum ATCC 25586]AVQ15720.1 PhzF family phenazine biosynthesis protein [Fusobacterium nucleatum subsp. nucleatum ATCC 25586]
MKKGVDIMKIFVCDAFSSKIFKGNQAGVVILEENENYPRETLMKNIAAELKHSETAFVKKIDNKKFKIRYFTPTEEVELCGHATISVFSVLRELNIVSVGKYIAETLAGNLEIIIDKDFIWMDMASPKIEYIFNLDEIKEIYSAFNLDVNQAPKNLIPKVVNTGLSDIIIPIENKETLDSFVMNKEKVIEISKKYKVVGAHLFTLDKIKKVTAFCRNIAPLVGIDEECATGTSNGALTHYLKDYNIISTQDINIFIQGESMGKTSTILSRYKEDKKTIQIGGNAVISFECKLY